MINFITNLPQNLRTGGFSAMNAAAYATLAKAHEVYFAGPISPPPALREKALSKVTRLVGLQGDFFFFSPGRLRNIAAEVDLRRQPGADLDFYHGFTPWALTKTSRPYVAWSDCTFRDYIAIFHKHDQFRFADIKRIEESEALWLRDAQRVLFTSSWAAKRAISQYSLDIHRVGSVGIFGEIDMPDHDGYCGGREFAFISTNFETKGGRTVLAAFREVRKRHPDVGLVVVGDQPAPAPPEPGVRFTGFLRKEVPEEYRRFKEILGRARALVNATTSDTAPVLLIEAGYVGCPVISSRRFAIPELVDDRTTGLLLDDASQSCTIAKAMNWMLENEDEYQRMRVASWAKARGQHSRKRFETSLLSYVRDLVPAGRTPAGS